jgi:hypothetical protein
MAAIRLGDEVQDKVSGAKGIVIALTVWLNGCVRASVQQKTRKDGAVPDAFCVDIAQLKMVTPGKVKGENSDKLCITSDREERSTPPGGPIPMPKRLPDPTRDI